MIDGSPWKRFQLGWCPVVATMTQTPVSYTHLDVYKRQMYNTLNRYLLYCKIAQNLDIEERHLFIVEICQYIVWREQEIVEIKKRLRYAVRLETKWCDNDMIVN